jgi:hypothetical protein
MYTAGLPCIAQAFQEARQQQGQIAQVLFDRLNLVQVPFALLSVLTLPVVKFWGLRNRRLDLTALAFFVFLALLGNAFICGALFNPHNRYQSRLVGAACDRHGHSCLPEKRQDPPDKNYTKTKTCYA